MKSFALLSTLRQGFEEVSFMTHSRQLSKAPQRNKRTPVWWGICFILFQVCLKIGTAGLSLHGSDKVEKNTHTHCLTAHCVQLEREIEQRDSLRYRRTYVFQLSFSPKICILSYSEAVKVGYQSSSSRLHVIKTIIGQSENITSA